MGLIFYSTVLELALGGLLLFWLFYRYMTSNFSYWKDRSVAYKEPRFPFGTDGEIFLFRKPFGCHFQQTYTEFKNEKVVGLFLLRRPYLLVRDPELLKHIMTKDFNHFIDRGFVDNELLGPLLNHLFNMRGESWKTMRNKLVPAFTSGRMKLMYHLMEVCCEELMRELEPLAEENKDVSVKDFVASFTTDVIGTCGFGLQINSIQNPGNEFRVNGNKLFESLPKLRFFIQIIGFMLPSLIKKFHLIKPMTNNPESEKFFLKIVEETVAYREEHDVVRNDFIDILIKIKNNKNLLDDDKNDKNKKDEDNIEPGITLEQMTAQALLFFAAGFETTSSTISFCLYEISVNPDIQEKMRKEIDEVLARHNGKPNYQALKEMLYVEAVINETLRRYSSLSILERKCVEDYKVPGVDLVITKGMNVIIPAYAIHHDPEYYPEPYAFDPERFTDNKTSTKNNYTFIPFGEGPRMCIGNRFAMMQSKLCLSMLLHKFELSVTKETQIPLEISAKHFMTTPAKPIILKISKRKK